jgi:hypothetical protein
VGLRVRGGRWSTHLQAEVAVDRAFDYFRGTREFKTTALLRWHFVILGKVSG